MYAISLSDDESSVSPTILITASLDGVANWASVEDEIFRIMQVHEVEGLDPVFHKGKMIPSRVVEHERDQKPNLGDSLGIKNDKGSSS